MRGDNWICRATVVDAAKSSFGRGLPVSSAMCLMKTVLKLPPAMRMR